MMPMMASMTNRKIKGYRFTLSCSQPINGAASGIFDSAQNEAREASIFFPKTV
jgi:hypothetical protein